MSFRTIVDETASYVVLPEFWMEFWPFAPVLPLLLGAAVLWWKRRTAAISCLKWAVGLFLFGLLWITFLL